MTLAASARAAIGTLSVGLLVAAAPAAHAQTEQLSDERGQTYWSPVDRPATVRTRPSSRARITGRLGRVTYHGQTDVVVVLAQRARWYRVRFAGIGRRTGWVRRSALKPPRLTRTWVEIDKDRRTLTAYRGSRPVMRVPVGIGAGESPTPGGRFFIRERIEPADTGGIYGPLALGLSAYSRHRTDWPGGGQVGIHGTNQPTLIPGRISNGCIRLRNRDVLRLGRIVWRGTPVRVR